MTKRSPLDGVTEEDEGLRPALDYERYDDAMERPRPPRGHPDYGSGDDQSRPGPFAWLRGLFGI